MADSMTLNLAALSKSFYGKEAKRGAALLANFRNRGQLREAKRLLRYHSPVGITNNETWDRDAIDYLLSFYSMLEIALSINLIQLEFNSSLFEDATANLSYSPLKTYYEDHYPLALPKRLQGRISGTRVVSAESSPGASRLFFDFVPLTLFLETNEDMEAFLWVLDGGYRGEWHFERLVTVLGQKRHWAQYLNQPKSQNEGARVIRGLVKFIEFCVHFDFILSQAKAMPILREELYLYHSYWFESSAVIMRNRLRELLDVVEADGGDAGPVRESIERLYSFNVESSALQPLLGSGSSKLQQNAESSRKASTKRS